MKNLLLLAVLFLTAAHSVPSDAPAPAPESLHFDVLRVYPPIAPTRAELVSAQTLPDLNPHFKSEWIRSYISTSVSTLQNGKLKTDFGNSELLTPKQKAAILSADIGSEVRVSIKYIPENNLRHNEPKEMHFSFVQEPEHEAAFPGGKEKLLQYLKTNAIDKIPDGTFEGYDLATIGFSINERGMVTDVQAHVPFKNPQIDELLIAAVGSMPKWKPGQYANGKKVKQDFVFIVGNMRNCVLNTLNIRRDT
ncbi:MAG: hypothetical protein CMN32_08915 [Saprospirales bacterium]|nr:hypothetical protein [Saprospirales bacterium]